jgi:hypothetical protein
MARRHSRRTSRSVARGLGVWRSSRISSHIVSPGSIHWSEGKSLKMKMLNILGKGTQVTKPGLSCGFEEGC